MVDLLDSLLDPFERFSRSSATESIRTAVRGQRIRMIEEWMKITDTPAPIGGEAPRARLVANLATASGADEVCVDEAHNVIATLHGTEGKARIALVATIDDLATIAELRRGDAPLEVRGTRLVGPGTNTAATTTTGLAVLRLLAGLPGRLRRDVVVAFLTGEETGLTGMRRFVECSRPTPDIVVELMGGIGVVSYGALAMRTLRFTFEGSARHSLDGGEAEVTSALALTAVSLRELTPPPPGIQLVPPMTCEYDFSTLRVNQIHAGEIANHSPGSGWLTVAIRSTSQIELERFAAAAEEIAVRAACEVGTGMSMEVLYDDRRATLNGGNSHPLVRLACAASTAAGMPPVVWNWSSSNVNVAASSGIPGVALFGNRGGGRGTVDEWCDIELVLAGTEAALLLTMALAGAIDEQSSGQVPKGN